MIDLHTHSTASDGELAPAELVAAAKEGGVSVLALTDHDTFSGLDEAATAAKNAEIVFVPGIELNISWPSGEFHLLGLGLKSICEELVQITRALQNERKSRNQTILQKMSEAGYDVAYEEFVLLSGGKEREDTLGRPHLASYFVKKILSKKRKPPSTNSWESPRRFTSDDRARIWTKRFVRYKNPAAFPSSRIRFHFTFRGEKSPTFCAK